MKPIDVYVHTLPWFVSKHKTDWESRRMMQRLSDQFEDIRVHLPGDWLSGVRPNMEYAVAAIGRRLGFCNRARTATIRNKECRLWMPDLRKMAPHVIIAQDHCPSNAGAIPVLWESFFVDPCNAVTEVGPKETDAWEAWKPVFRELGSRAKLIGLRGQYSVALAGRHFPELAPKIRDLPFYLPYLDPVAEDLAAAKQRYDGPLHLLFVGRQARLKGLPAVVDAVAHAEKSIPTGLHLHIVSRFDDGRVPLTRLRQVTVYDEMSRASVQNLVRKCHVVIMPSRKESYGWIYLEGMAAGCVVMARDFEPQREIVDYGRAGILIDPRSPSSIAEALVEIATNPDKRQELAVAAVRRFSSKFHWPVVGKTWRNAIRECVDLVDGPNPVAESRPPVPAMRGRDAP